MIIMNPFDEINREKRKYIISLSSIQISLFGLIWLSYVGIELPIIQQAVSFVYLTFVPGIVILQILNSCKFKFNVGSHSLTEYLLYSVGLSVSFLMIVGLLMNLLGPILGFHEPLSTKSTLFWVGICTLIPFLISCFTKYPKAEGTEKIIRKKMTVTEFSLFFLPVIAIVGTYMVNKYNENFILILLLVIISIIPMMVIGNYIRQEYFSLTIYLTAITLLLHKSLISPYISGWDIHHESYLSNLVLAASLWDPSIQDNYNATLSTVILAPIYSIFSGLDIFEVFKFIYPVIFAFVPVGLYAIFRKQISAKISFLACFYFVSVFTFYSEMLGIARQEIAELFFVLLVLTMLNVSLSNQVRSVFFILFCFSLVVSHYALAIIFLVCLVGTFAINQLLNITLGRFVTSSLSDGASRFTQFSCEILKNFHNSKYPIYQTAFMVTLTIVWFIYTSGSSTFSSVVYLSKVVVDCFALDLFNPESVQGLGIILNETVSPYRFIYKILILSSQLLIVIGFIKVVVDRKSKTFSGDFLALSLVSLSLCIGGIILPYFASALNTSRLFHLSLIVLSPFCIIGGFTVLNLFYSLFNRIVKIRDPENKSYYLLSLFLCVFLLFNSGLVFELVKDKPTSISLNSTYDYPQFSAPEIIATKWLVNHDNEYPVYADGYRKNLLDGLFNRDLIRQIPDDQMLPNDVYIFLGKYNVLAGDTILVWYKEKAHAVSYYIKFNGNAIGKHQIYVNGDAKYYLNCAS